MKVGKQLTTLSSQPRPTTLNGQSDDPTQRESMYSFPGDVEDGDAEVGITLQSQIHVTATLSTQEPFV
jgi:hypothetical protein